MGIYLSNKFTPVRNSTKEIDTNYIFSIPFDTHTFVLSNLQYTLPFTKINDYLIANFMFKYEIGLLPNIFDTFFSKNSSIHSYNTRQSNVYHIHSVRLTFSQFCLRFKGPKLWNNVPENIKLIKNLNMFKKKIKSIFLT